jgi:predicted phage terminase large subunit-like protein
VIAQRLGELDLSAHVLANEPRVVHLKIPMWFVPKDRCETDIEYLDIDDNWAEKRGWQDPRTEDRELMWPEHMTEERTEKLKTGLANAHMISAQMQQEPTAPSGDFFQSEWFVEVENFPRTGIKAIRAWDKAASTGKRADYTAGVLVVYDGDYFYIADVVRGKWGRKERDAFILKTSVEDAQKFGNYTVLFEQEPGSGGKESSEISASEIRNAGISVRIDKPTSKKLTMWDPLQKEMAKGSVRYVKAPWNDMWKNEMLSAGPDGVYGSHDDMIDATAAALRKAAKARGVGKITRELLLITDEEQAEFAAEESKKSEMSEYLDLIDSVQENPLGVKW